MFAFEIYDIQIITYDIPDYGVRAHVSIIARLIRYMYIIAILDKTRSNLPN